MASPLATLGSKFLFHGIKKAWQPVLSGAEGSHASAAEAMRSNA